jgi:hypothetical protein
VKPESGSVTEILRITSSGARALLVMFLFVDLLLATSTITNVYNPVPTIVALVLVGAAAIVVTLPAPEPLPLSRSAIVLAATTLSTVLVDWNIPPTNDTGYESWNYGANTLVLLFVGLRGRTGLAWLGFGLIVGITAIWTAVTGSMLLIQLIPNQVGTMVVGTLFAIGLRQTSARITALHAEQAALASAESAARAAAAERARQAAHLNEVARPALERIAQGAPFSDEERDGWMRLEASVRDSLRAPMLNTHEIIAAADSARARGVEVTLLDDSAGGVTSAADREAIAAAIVSELGTLESGRLIGRVLPVGRGQLATIVVDDGVATRRTDVG